MNIKKSKPVQSGNIISLIFSIGVWLSGCCILVIFLALIFELLVQGKQAFTVFGFDFLINSSWDPVHQNFGALPALIGTLLTSIIGVLIAVPLSFGCAYCLSELLPSFIARYLTVAVQLLAAIPSIILGMWGFFIIIPLMSQYVQPFLKETLGTIPYLDILFSGPPFGVGTLTAGLILAVMITPFITAVMQDAFSGMPAMLKESAYSLGSTKWEVMRFVTLPWSQKIVTGGVILGWGRALGETMAVTFVIGNAHHAGWSLFTPSNTIASLIALEFSESAAGSLKMSSLMALGVVLMVISFVVLFCSQFLLKRMFRT